MSQSLIPSSNGATHLLQHLSSFPACSTPSHNAAAPGKPGALHPTSSPKAWSQNRARQHFQQGPGAPKHLYLVCSPTRLQTPDWTTWQDRFCHNDTSYAELPQKEPNGPSTVWQLLNPTWCQGLSSPCCSCSWPALETRMTHTFLSRSHKRLKTKHFILLPVQNGLQ